jgi:lysophospholipase L1-like esterase
MKDLLTVVLGENDMQTTVPNNGTKKNNDLVNLIYESGTPARGEASSIHDT